MIEECLDSSVILDRWLELCDDKGIDVEVKEVSRPIQRHVALYKAPVLNLKEEEVVKDLEKRKLWYLARVFADTPWYGGTL